MKTEEKPSNYVVQGIAIIAQMDRPEDLARLPDDRVDHLCAWIRHRLQKPESGEWSKNRKERSFGLKLQYEEESGYYVTNGQFKGAMLRCGYEPKNAKMLDWEYKVEVKVNRG